MRKVGRGIGAAVGVFAIAGALLVVGGIGPFGRPAGSTTEPVAKQTAGNEVSSLLPVSGGPSGGSLDATIASL